MDKQYRQDADERAKLGIPPLPLDTNQTKQVCSWLAEGKTTPPDGDENLLSLLADRVPPGVDDAAGVKTEFLSRVAQGAVQVPGLTPEYAVELLGTMLGGFNLMALLELLTNDKLADATVKALTGQILAGDAVVRVGELAKQGNPQAKRLLEAWANAEWFVNAPKLPLRIPLRVYKVDGEINTDDLSPAKQASTRPDIPLHALSMGETRFPGGLAAIAAMREEAEKDGYFPAFVADTLGTGSSRKSATNSLVWHLGNDIPHIPNKRRGGVVIADRIAPIFYNSFEDAGGLPIHADVKNLQTGMKIALEIDAAKGSGRILSEDGKEITAFAFPKMLADEWRAGGRLNLIIGRRFAARAAKTLGVQETTVFTEQEQPKAKPGQGYTLAQKMVGASCGKDGVLPGENVEPAMSTVGSQDTTGPMTRDELKDLACLKFTAPMVMQSFCHTAAYPNDRDKKMQATLPGFIQERGGVALKPGDGIVHSWLNRLLVPDKVGTGGDSHTRFPLGISFAAGSGLVALAAAMGFMPLEMPESILVAFSGKLPVGITLRDIVNAIPLMAMKKGLLDMPGSGTRNIFNGRVMEMEGICSLTVEQAFELACASAERSAAACTVALMEDKVVDYVKSNVALIKTLIRDGYQDVKALEKRKAELEKWLEKPSLMKRDDNAEFAARLDIDLADIKEPAIACPNNPDMVAWLSERAGEKIDEVFIGSCMSNIVHFRAAAKIFSGADARLGVKRLWITTPTRMDHDKLAQEGVLQCFEKFAARIEIPGCSLCMGNQARVEDNAVVFSTSTRNFNNRMGAGAQVYLGSAILAAVTARLGKLPTPEEYLDIYRRFVLPVEEEISSPLYFHLLPEYK